jgi:serine-type D-Ala-D-Ala carboxypeptidase (penicillin-binding protein 5/6)
MSSSRPPLLTGGRRRRRRRVGGPVLARERRQRSRAPLVLLGAIALLLLVVVALSLLDTATSRQGEESASQPLPALSPGPAAASPRSQSMWERHRSAEDARFAVDLSRPDLVKLRFVRKPRAGLLFDVRTGRVLWRRKPGRLLPIASLTKMMTALVVVERRDSHDRVKITKQVVRTPGSKVGVLPKGKKVQLEALMNGLLLVSGNDAAVALARHTAGDVERFVRLMNRRASRLGLSCTHFSTPHGLRDQGNRSCAADLATLARADLAQRRIRRIVRRKRAILKFPIKGGRLFLYNHNPLVRSGYRGVTGLKTGYTDRAGQSIVATAKRGRRELGVVLLHSYNPSDQAQRLLNRGFKTLRTRG